MKCETYVFLITSGKLEEANKLQSMDASFHGLMCKKCRQFKKNHELLNSYLEKKSTKFKVQFAAC